MRKALSLPLLLLAVFMTVGIEKGCGDSWTAEASKNINSLGIAKVYYDGRDFKYRTPRGVVIESVVPVPPTALVSIDRALQRRIDRFNIMFPNWPLAKTISSENVIWFVHPNSVQQADRTETGPCVLESIPGAPCLYVKGWKTAGTVLGTSRLWGKINRKPPLVLPHQGNGSWQWLDYLEAAVHNEDEHRSGWLNQTYDPTGVFYHFLGANDVHPWQWGDTPVPFSGDFVMPDEVNHCLPIPTDAELKKIADELGISYDDLKKDFKQE